MTRVSSGRMPEAGAGARRMLSVPGAVSVVAIGRLLRSLGGGSGRATVITAETDHTRGKLSG
ncbi:hypothetical protein Microterr_16980 [Microbacterium terricola]|uniref:Uncharacterized protein n=1 Tax=Microbacterium terricola TaxID=344163 RepID=A0ABM8DZC1_9MICO|nr:hypothetical protein Microterr_16980 [Microbacterium terricola]